MIEISSLNKRFGKLTVLDGLDLTIDSGGIFAILGPNGSGKSTLIDRLKEGINLYSIINPDVLYKDLTENKIIELASYGIQVTPKEFFRFIQNSTYSDKIKNGLLPAYIRQNRLYIGSVKIDPYKIALIAAFLRSCMVRDRISFSFETVFSHPSKISFLGKAKLSGYRNYLYYIATDNCEINVGRVEQRVAEGGHSVPEGKIRSRYNSSLKNLLPALKHTYRAYIFDNSGEESRWIAEVTPKGTLLLRTVNIPIWFDEYVLKQLQII
jgi:predicted ABC-type ATPase